MVVTSLNQSSSMFEHLVSLFKDRVTNKQETSVHIYQIDERVAANDLTLSLVQFDVTEMKQGLNAIHNLLLELVKK
jgi:hypothetical protein